MFGFMDEWPDRWETGYELSGLECWTLTKAISWCNRQLTDGHVSARALPKIATDVDPQEFAARMVELELWEPVGRGGWQFVGWSSPDGFSQLTSEHIQTKREGNAFTTARSRRHKAGDHLLCLPTWCGQAPESNTTESTRQAWRDASRDPSRTTSVTDSSQAKPSPARGEVKGKANARAARRSPSAGAAGSGSDALEKRPRRFGPSDEVRAQMVAELRKETA